VTPIMCSYKIVQVSFEVWGLQTRAEDLIQRVLLALLVTSVGIVVRIALEGVRYNEWRGVAFFSDRNETFLVFRSRSWGCGIVRCGQ
jgi:hypothetical protein